MSLISKVEKILCKDKIDWDDVRSIIPMCSIVLIDKLLLGVVKHQDVPEEVVSLLACTARLKTVRKAFDKACFQDGISNDILDNLLHELEPLKPDTIEICVRSCLRSKRLKVLNRLIHHDEDFLSSNFAKSTFEDETDFHLLADMLIKTDILRYKEEMIMKDNMIHQFVGGPERIDIVSIILDLFPHAVKSLDNGKLPLHYALKSKNFSVASMLIIKGIQIGMHLGGLLKECDQMISPLTCALEVDTRDDATSNMNIRKHIGNVVEWLLTSNLLEEDVRVACQIINIALGYGLVDLATDTYKLAREINVPIDDMISKTFLQVSDELISKCKFDSHVAFIHVNKVKANSGLWYGEDSCDDKDSDARAVSFYNEEIQLNHKYSSWLDDIFHSLVRNNNIDCVKLLLSSHPNLLWCPSYTGALPIHTASQIKDCFSMVILLFEEAILTEAFPMKHGGIFAGYCHHRIGHFIEDPPFCKIFSSLNDIELDCLRRLIGIDPTLPYIPFALYVGYDVNIKFFLHSTLRWDPMSQFNGMHALFYALEAIYADLSPSDSISFVDSCLDSNSEWHKCVHTRDSRGQLPLHFVLCLSKQYGSRIHPALRKFLTHSCNLKYLDVLDKIEVLYPALLSAAYIDVALTYELLRLNVQVVTQHFEKR